MHGVQRFETTSTMRCRGWVIAILTSSMICACAAQAQSVPAPTHAPAPPTTASPPRPAASSSAAPSAPAAGAPASPAEGPSEGITVHGQWVIEVRNPDGTVTARRDFENELQVFGASFFASSLIGPFANVSGGLSILLNGSGTTFTIAPGNVGPPQYTINFFYPQFPTTSGPCTGTGTWTVPGQNTPPAPVYVPFITATCVITTPQKMPPATSNTGSWLTSLCYQQSGLCSANLTAGRTNNQVTLSGSIKVSSSTPGTINDVETVLTECDIASSIFNCENVWDFDASGISASMPVTFHNMMMGIFTQKILDGLNGDPVAVPYGPGQTIAIAVTISFQ
jgi:hypothetical protein